VPKPDRYVEFVVEQFSPLGRITTRFMFGGWCLYCEGTVFALVANGSVFLKGDAESIPKFEARGLPAFRPFPDQDLTMKYFQAPPEIFEDGDAMREWCGLAIAAGRRASKPKGRTSKPKKNPTRAAKRKSAGSK
jgi:DNA transformation protein